MLGDMISLRLSVLACKEGVGWVRAGDRAVLNRKKKRVP